MTVGCHTLQSLGCTVGSVNISLTLRCTVGSQLVVGLRSVLAVVIGAGVTHGIGRALGSTGTYSQLVYAMATYLAPWSLITMVVGSIPLVNYLVLPLAIYGIVLNVIAVKAANHFGWGKAIAASAAGIVVGILVVVGCVLAGSL